VFADIAGDRLRKIDRGFRPSMGPVKGVAYCRPDGPCIVSPGDGRSDGADRTDGKSNAWKQTLRDAARLPNLGRMFRSRASHKRDLR